MITDVLINSSIYNGISRHFEQAFDFIKSIDETFDVGTYKINDGLFGYIMEYQTGPEFKFGWESHKKFIDIQYCIVGKERIQWSPVKKNITETHKYNSIKDVSFFKGKGEPTFIDTGDDVFAIFFPEDAHAPQLMINRPEIIRKVVVKVPF